MKIDWDGTSSIEYVALVNGVDKETRVMGPYVDVESAKEAVEDLYVKRELTEYYTVSIVRADVVACCCF